MNPRYSLIALRAGHRCEYCHAPEAVFNLSFEVEHIVPVAREGEDTSDNLALACRSCNLRKGVQMTGIDPDSGQSAPLFHPRRHSWEEHFRADEETAEVHGRTAIGRLTVAGLAMNSPTQLVARRQWMRLGLFP